MSPRYYQKFRPTLRTIGQGLELRMLTVGDSTIAGDGLDTINDTVTLQFVSRFAAAVRFLAGVRYDGREFHHNVDGLGTTATGDFYLLLPAFRRIAGMRGQTLDVGLVDVTKRSVGVSHLAFVFSPWGLAFAADGSPLRTDVQSS